MFKKISYKIGVMALFCVSILGVITDLPTASAATSNETLSSLEEMAELSTNFNAEREKACKGSADLTDCYMHYYFDREDMGEEYARIGGYDGRNLIVTKINPSKNSVSILYKNDRIDESIWLGEEIQADLSYLRIIWLDSDQLEKELDAAPDILVDGMHYIVDRPVTEEENQILLTSEMEFVDPSATLSSSDTGVLSFYYVDSRDVAYGDVAIYKDCLESEDYHEGMECKVMFDEVGNLVYIPAYPESEILTELKMATGNMKIENSDIDVNAEELSIFSSTESELTKDISTLSSSKNSNQELFSENTKQETVILAPDTGKILEEKSVKDLSISYLMFWLSVGTLFLTFFIGLIVKLHN